MSQSDSRWDDLTPRLVSGGAMAALGVACIWAGGPAFLILVAAVTGIMCWELARMNAPDTSGSRALILGLAAAAALWAEVIVGAPLAFALIIPVLALATLMMARDRLVFALFFGALLIAGYGLVTFRAENGVVWLLWLVLVVTMTDILGYFAGRYIGGPKFWPAVSPKKTWSGTAAGWLGAGLIGFAFTTFTRAGLDLIWISMLLSLASQLGDIAESAVKRRWGVKDSSTLIPGHGGLFDRFDGLLGAALFMLLVAQVVDVPEVRL